VTFHFHTAPLFKTSAYITKYIITRNSRFLGLVDHCALFVDISGFTPITDAIMKTVMA